MKSNDCATCEGFFQEGRKYWEGDPIVLLKVVEHIHELHRKLILRNE